MTQTAATSRPAAIAATTVGTSSGYAGTVTSGPFCTAPYDPQPGRITLTAVEPVYGTVIQTARLVWRLQGLRFTVTGVENLPTTGGAVVAINWMPMCCPAQASLVWTIGTFT